MSPYENYDHGAGELRTKYAYLFTTVAEMYRLYHPREKITPRFENVEELTQKLYDDKVIDDYLFDSLKDVYSKYPSLLPAVVAQGYKEDKVKENEHLNKLFELLSITQGELSQLYHDIIEEDQDRFMDDWVKRHY